MYDLGYKKSTKTFRWGIPTLSVETTSITVPTSWSKKTVGKRSKRFNKRRWWKANQMNTKHGRRRRGEGFEKNWYAFLVTRLAYFSWQSKHYTPDPSPEIKRKGGILSSGFYSSTIFCYIHMVLGRLRVDSSSFSPRFLWNFIYFCFDTQYNIFEHKRFKL